MISKIKIPLIVLSLPVLAYFVFETIYFNAAYPNIYLGTLPVGGKNKSELRDLITTEFQNRQNRTISFSINKSKPIAITLSKDYLNYNVEETLNKITGYGKTGSLRKQINQKLSVFSKITLSPVYLFDEITFDTILADAVRPFEQEVIETKIVYAKGELVLSPSKPGQKVTRQELLAEVKKIIELESNTAVFSTTLQTIEPRTTRDNSRTALQLAQKAISKQITLYSTEIPDKSWTLNTPELYEFLEFKFDEETKKPTVTIANYKIASYSAQFAPLIQKDPKEAKFETAGDKVIVFETSEDGRALDTEKLTQQITAAAFNNALSSRIELPIKTLTPAVTQTTVNQYGIKELIAQGSSKFERSSNNRIHNIEVATEKLNGAIITPDQIFSMYQTVGDIEKQTGFVDSTIIKNGRTITGIGGGVCQVSTTLFRAALNAGLPIIERSPHSYRVNYYEQDSPPGLDAAIYFPSQDIKFKNNTGNNILIQTKLNKETASLIINFFGVKDGRVVQITSPEITDQINPPPEARIIDPSIRKGIIRQTEATAQGATVLINRTVTKEDQIILQDTIKSNYRPWQAVYLIGTGTD